MVRAASAAARPTAAPERVGPTARPTAATGPWRAGASCARASACLAWAATAPLPTSARSTSRATPTPPWSTSPRLACLALFWSRRAAPRALYWFASSRAPKAPPRARSCPRPGCCPPMRSKRHGPGSTPAPPPTAAAPTTPACRRPTTPPDGSRPRCTAARPSCRSRSASTATAPRSRAAMWTCPATAATPPAGAPTAPSATAAWRTSAALRPATFATGSPPPTWASCRTARMSAAPSTRPSTATPVMPSPSTCSAPATCSSATSTRRWPRSTCPAGCRPRASGRRAAAATSTATATMASATVLWPMTPALRAAPTATPTAPAARRPGGRG